MKIEKIQNNSSELKCITTNSNWLPKTITMIASILCATIAVALGEQSEEAEPSAPFEQVSETESEDKDLW